jgi:hypothetical protein
MTEVNGTPVNVITDTPLAVLREELRREMAEQAITDDRITYSDGYASGLSRSINGIDQILLLGPETMYTDDVVAARHVEGVCPACHEQQLYLNGQGKIECDNSECPDVIAATTLISGVYVPPQGDEYDLRIKLNRPYVILLPGNGGAFIVEDNATEIRTGWPPITRAVVCARLDAISDMIDQEGTP